MVDRRILFGALVIVVSVGAAPADRSAWKRRPVCTAPGERAGVSIASDGRGGAIVAWESWRKEAKPGNSELYLRSVTTSGAVRWPRGGHTLCAAPGARAAVHLVPDGEGGVIAAWSDYRLGVGAGFAQRIDARGKALWPRDGIEVVPPRSGEHLVVAADGAGGAIIVSQLLDSPNRTIHAQRVDADGRRMWGPAGVDICTNPGIHMAPHVVPDGVGGAIITWTEQQQARDRILAQRVSANGDVEWTPNGASLFYVARDQRFGTAVSDGAGGAIVVWVESRPNTADTLSLFAQRVDTSGRRLWDPRGIHVSRRPVSDHVLIVVRATNDGAIVGWQDHLSGKYEIFAQSIDAAGDTRWGLDGVAVCVAEPGQGMPVITSDQHGGAFLAWEEQRPGVLGIFAQHVDAHGSAIWGPAGSLVSIGNADSPVIIEDGRGGAYLAWVEVGGRRRDMFVFAELIAGRPPAKK